MYVKNMQQVKPQKKMFGAIFVGMALTISLVSFAFGAINNYKLDREMDRMFARSRDPKKQDKN